MCPACFTLAFKHQWNLSIILVTRLLHLSFLEATRGGKKWEISHVNSMLIVAQGSDTPTALPHVLLSYWLNDLSLSDITGDGFFLLVRMLSGMTVCACSLALEFWVPIGRKISINRTEAQTPIGGLYCTNGNALAPIRYRGGEFYATFTGRSLRCQCFVFVCKQTNKQIREAGKGTPVSSCLNVSKSRK